MFSLFKKKSEAVEEEITYEVADQALQSCDDVIAKARALNKKLSTLENKGIKEINNFVQGLH